MEQKLYLLIIVIISCELQLFCQNTVGLLSYQPDKSYDGYNLIFPHNQSTVYLFDNCGQIINSWPDDEGWRPGNSVYLLENGDLVKCKRRFDAQTDRIWEPGGGDVVEIRNWDNELLWTFTQNDSLNRIHHDIEPMPNGNILMISWELKTELEAIEAGRNPMVIQQGEIYPDYILEVNPRTDSVVWEWHAWDHLIQDFDSTKNNFGIVENHPELIDINFTPGDGHPDWMHVNSIDYNAELDQIMISVPEFSEIWIIDHSTTTMEAAGHSGGLSDRGGDLLFRWGNPLVYRNGNEEDQQLFYQHDAKWITQFLSEENVYYGMISLFNNRVAENFSTANILQPKFDTLNWTYLMSNERFQPVDFERIINHPIANNLLQSIVVSSVQVLPNNNVLICAGRTGYSLEITPQNEVVWEYETPINGGTLASQGDSLTDISNITFRLERYPIDFPAFEGKDLLPKGYIELNPNEAFCDQILPVENISSIDEDILIFPNPASNSLSIIAQNQQIDFIEIMDMHGKKYLYRPISSFSTTIDISLLPNQLYVVRINNRVLKKLLVVK